MFSLFVSHCLRVGFSDRLRLQLGRDRFRFPDLYAHGVGRIFAVRKRKAEFPA